MTIQIRSMSFWSRLTKILPSLNMEFGLEGNSSWYPFLNKNIHNRSTNSIPKIIRYFTLFWTCQLRNDNVIISPKRRILYNTIIYP